jgi:hypothetical protein
MGPHPLIQSRTIQRHTRRGEHVITDLTMASSIVSVGVRLS